MRLLTTAILLGITALAPAALAQTAGPSIPSSALDGQIRAKAPTSRSVHHAKKRAARHSVRRARAHRPVVKAKAVARRAPVRHAVTAGLMLV